MRNKLKLICISDSHEQHDKITMPDGDMLIHSGDWTYKGSYNAVKSFLDWFSSQPHKFKIFIAGNHELNLDFNNPNRNKILALIKSYTDKDNNLHYLENSSINIEGLNVFGSPVSCFFHSWAFNYQRGKDIAAVWKKIPDNTNLLLVHGPPANIGMLDAAPRGFGEVEHVGCEDLYNRINELKYLRAVCVGHIHNGYSVVEQNGIKFVNASICTEQYKPTNKPIIIEI